MRLNLRIGIGRRGVVMAMALSVALAAPRRSSAEVITIDDGGRPGTTDLPFTCSVDGERPLWLPSMGFVYRNVEAFDLVPGDTIAFDLQMRAADPADLGFLPQLDIALAHAPDPQNPFKPDDLPGSDFTIVAHAGVAASPGNRVIGDYELAFAVDTPFHFSGGGLIIRVTNPRGVLATRTDQQCLPVITADAQPTGTNRLVGTFALEAGEYPWKVENTTNLPGVPYVRIIWTRCGDGVQQMTEECDNSAHPDRPDPFCDSTCHLAAVAKGSGCGAGAGAGLAMALVIFALALARRRRVTGLAVLIAASWAGSARAQAKTDGFRVDRFEMAPSVDDGLVVQDPGVLRHMVWSVNAMLGFTNTLLRVAPNLSSSSGVDVVGARLSADLDFALGLGDRFEVNVAVPFALAQASEAGTAAGIMLSRAGMTAVGDARVGGSALLYGRNTGPRVGLAANVAIPVGSQTSFTGDRGAGAEVLATGGFVAPRYRVIVNGGVRLRREAGYVTTDQGTELVGRAGVFVPVANDRLTTSLELDLMARASGHDAYKELGAPILALLGARYHFAGGVRAGAGIGMGLTEAPGSPAVRALVTIGYSPEPEPSRPKPAPAPVPVPVDSDGDRIPDTLDKCPSQPEDYNGFQDEDGCPDGPPDAGKPLTLEDVVTLPAPIEFKFDTAIMLPGAEIYLNQVLEILQKHSEVQKLEIQGHTSSEGGAEYNLRLSNDRARAVFAWLVDHGIAAQRLVPHGYGLTQPLVPNDSEPNRQRNRRVQFRLLEQAPGSAPIGGLRPSATPATAPPPPATPPAATPRAH
jgi:outer membrane protein OmpA-like peptidoglycan-associated protein